MTTPRLLDRLRAAVRARHYSLRTGAEYAAYAFRARLAALGITQSMKRPREITDNAFAKSFFHTLKSDVIHGNTFDDDRSLNHVIRR